MFAMAFLKRFLLFFLLGWSFVLAIQPVLAQANPQNPSQLLAQNTLIPLDSPNYPGVNVRNLVEPGTNIQGAQGVVNVLKGLYSRSLGILGPVLVLLLAWFSIRLIIAGGNEEKFTQVSQHFLYLLIGTAFVVFAKFLSETFFLYQEGASFVSSEGNILTASSRFQSQVEILIVFLRYVLSGLAVFYIVKSGATILFSADDELVNKQKDVFLYGFMGFLLIMISSALIDVVFNINTIGIDQSLGNIFLSQQVNVEGGISLLGNITNLFLAALSGLFLFMLVAGGVLYAFSGGNEERGQKATKIITGSIIGLVIAFSSYTIVAEFSTGGRAVSPTSTTTAPLNTPPPNLPNLNPGPNTTP